MTGSNVSKLGRVALDLGFLNIKQLEECLKLQIEYQKAGREVPRLGSVLLSKKYITSEQLKIILEKQKDAKYQNASASTHEILKFFPAGTYIYNRGEKSKQLLYLIHDGKIDFYCEDDLIDSMQGKGKFFGVVSLLTATAYTESAVAAKDSQVFAIPSSEVETFLKGRPELSLKIAKKLADSLYKLEVKTNPFPSSTLSTQDSEFAEGSASTLKSENAEDSNSDIATADSESADSTAKVAGEADAESALKKKSIPIVEAASANTEETVADNSEVVTATADEGHDRIQLSRLNEDTINQQVFISTAVDCTELITKIEEIKPKRFTKEIVNAVKEIVKIYIKVDSIDQERNSFLAGLENPNEILKSELNRQNKEYITIPTLETLAEHYTQHKALLDNKDNLQGLEKSKGNAQDIAAGEPKNSVNEDSEQLSANGVDAKVTADTAAVSQQQGQGKLLSKTLVQAYEFSIRQKELLIRRYNELPAILQTCASFSEDEPFYQLLSKYDIDPTNIFGYAVYYMALKEYSDMQSGKILTAKKEREELGTGINSIVGILKFNKSADAEREEQYKAVKAREEHLKLLQVIIARELKNIERAMVNEFWDVYGKVALLLVTPLPGLDKVMFKCFLRWGLLGYSQKWIDNERCVKFIKACSQELCSPVFSTTASLIYYADEFMELVAKGFLPSSPNEDLELNHRNSPAWKCDRGYKRYCYLKFQYGVLVDVLKSIRGEVDSITHKISEFERLENDMKKSRSMVVTHKAELSEMRQEVQGYKVRTTRLNSIIAKIVDVMLPNIFDDSMSSINMINESGVELKSSEIILHEVACMRRASKLVAKLKEPFLPFVLRDSYTDGNGVSNDRDIVASAIAAAEAKDPLMFTTKLISSAKRKQRILVRKPPCVVITPSVGSSGQVIAPRSGIENGRFVLPGYYEKPLMNLEAMLNVLSDFRFDCSKADAGIDVMTSDTLVAAYATFRWNMRKKRKDIRKKAGIFLDEAERLNWRRQYKMYMNSAEEGGKFLFYKCPDLYEALINKHIDLPGDIEKLKR